MDKEQQREILLDLENIKKALDSSFIVAITDPTGLITSVNQKFCEISGYASEELIGQNHRIINSGYHSKDFFQDLWKTISSGKKWEGDVRNRAKDGSLYWVHTVIVPSVNKLGQISEYVSIRYDITAKKEQEINQNALIETAFDGLVIYNLSGKVLWSNFVAETLLNIKVIESKDLYIDEVFPEKFPIFQSGNFVLSVKNDDEVKKFEVASKEYLFKGHRAFLVACRDVSQREALQNQMLQQDRLASIGLLASGLAHEIGTPLGIMRGRAELLAMNVQDGEAVKSGSNVIIQQIDRISKLIHSLLGLARGSSSVTAMPTDICQVCEDVLGLLAHEARKSNTEIANSIREHSYAMAVSASLFQVILNITVNALHAIQERQKNSTQHQGRISFVYSEQNQVATIQISDNGCGISEENLAKIFNPFFTTKEVGKGTGLGLATSYRMVEAWGGQIQVESEVSVGTRFFIRLKKPNLAL